ncbi:macro domain-containing protein [Haliea sp. E1-2-M8]|uniref:macro domain-containing protein n=1 Tax=Haliea sp. E1-2-M8 TaxID=3064706 RepID=UPI00271D65F7|nr:macro domain-containing protein [Haliea sp. E1-2-M8]MDO8863883.1 macro domain-containing protein [Haliea sp. E1-2-M8]
MSTEKQAVTVECVTGDIVRQPDVDAVVNAANAALMSGGGVAGAIHRAAGPGLARECQPLAPIEPGEAVITGGHNLPNRWVIHCLGPIHGIDEPADALLAACYENALRLAEENAIARLAFPAISTGAFGYPAEAAAAVCAGALKAALPQLQQVTLVRFVLFDDAARQVLERALADAGLTL